MLSVESDDIAGWPAAKRLTLPGQGGLVARRRPDRAPCDRRLPARRRPLPQHVPAAEPGRSARGPRRRRPRRPDAAQLPPALPRGDVPPRRPGVRGLPGPRPGPGGRPRLLPLVSRGHAPDRREGRAAQRDRHLVRPRSTPTSRRRSSRAAATSRPAGPPTASPSSTTPPPTPARRAGATTAASSASPGLLRRRASTCCSRRGGGPSPTAASGCRIVGSGELEPTLRRQRPSRWPGSSSPASSRARRGFASWPEARALVVPSRWYEVFPRIVAEAYALGDPGGRLAAGQPGRDRRRRRDRPPRSSRATRPALAQALRAPGRRPASLVERLGAGARREYERNLSPTRDGRPAARDLSRRGRRSRGV